MKKTNIKKILKKSGFIIYNFQGSSMLPLLVEKEDKVHLKACDSYELFDVVLFERYTGYYVLHRIVDIRDDKYYIMGDNSPVLDILTKDQILAKMIGYYKKENYYEITSESYVKNLENFKAKFLPEKDKILADPKEYFYSRKKKAYYEALKYAFDKPFDGEFITDLLDFEKLELVNHCHKNKALPILGQMVANRAISLTPELNKIVIDSVNEAKLRYIRSEEAVKRLTKAFSENKIPHIFLKGSEIRNEYPHPFLRLANDIDLLVKPEDFEKAKSILINQFGGRYYATTQHDESYICDDLKIDVELHHHINTDLPEDVMYVTEDLFKNATKDNESEYRFHASANMSKIVNLSHCAKHLNGGEFWVSMILDFYLLDKLPYENQVLVDTRLDKFNETMKHYLSHIFEGEKLSKTEEDFERFLFKNHTEVYMSLSKGKYKTKFAYIMNRIFLPYRYFAPRHPTLQKHPWLLPFYEVARWVKAPFKKGSFKRYSNEIDNYEKTNENEIKSLTDVGLSEYIVKYEDHKDRF